MTRDVLILRHANAVPLANGVSDFDRVLSAHGEQEADAVAAWLAGHQVKLDRVLSSPAARAKATAERAIAPLGAPAITFEQQIYEATPGTLMSVLDRSAGPGNTLLVGHNPGLEQLVALLLEGRSGDVRGLPTAGLAWVRVPAEGEIEPGCGELKHYWWP
jgi:phosphohistidine phosphatase